MQSGILKTTLEGYMVSSVAITPDGKTIVSGAWDKTIKLWDIQSGILKATFKGHTDTVYSVAITPDGKTIVSGSKDKTIKLWDVGILKNLNEKTYIKKQIKNLEQQCQARLEGISLIPTEIPFDKPIWSKQHPFHWLDKAQKGDAKAMYELGVIYDRDGETQKALEWYRKSLNAGNSEEKERVEFLERWMKDHNKSIEEK